MVTHRHEGIILRPQLSFSGATCSGQSENRQHLLLVLPPLLPESPLPLPGFTLPLAPGAPKGKKNIYSDCLQAGVEMKFYPGLLPLNMAPNSGLVLPSYLSAAELN